jgi:hypothetical protein
VGPGVGQALITTAPHGNAFTVFYNRSDEENTHHIVARSPDNRLLEWSWGSRDQTWRVVSLTDYAEKVGPGVGSALIGSAPGGYSFWALQDTQHAVARSLYDGRLLEWSWSSRDQTWRVVSLTDRAEKVGPGVGQALIGGAPHGYELPRVSAGEFTQHIVARSPDNRLLEWSWSSRDQTWRVVSLTDYAEKVGWEVGSALIGSAPRGYEFRDETHVVTRSLENRLLVWSWNAREAIWRVEIVG